MWKKLKFQVNKIIIKINLLWTCLLLWVWTQMVWATSEYRGRRKHPRKSMSVPTGRRQSLPKPFVSGKKNQSLCTHLLIELHMKELNESNMWFVVELALTSPEAQRKEITPHYDLSSKFSPHVLNITHALVMYSNFLYKLKECLPHQNTFFMPDIMRRNWVNLYRSILVGHRRPNRS